MIVKIAIASEDREYLRRLVNVMEKDTDFNITVYSDKDSLSEAIRNRKFDVFMFTQDIIADIVDGVRSELNILLDDEENSLSDSQGNISIIKKYQRISNIKKQIFDLYSDVCGKDSRSERGERASVIAFYSPIGGAGKTTISLMTAGKFAAEGKKTFYINLEDISSESFYLPQDEEKGMSEFMGFVEKDVNLGMKLQGMLKEKKQGMYYLNSFSSPNDILEMTANDIRMMITKLMKTGIFDVVVIDLSTRVDDKTKAIFELSDKIVFVEKSDEISIRKLKEFYKQKHLINEYAYKATRIINKDNGLPVVSNNEVSIAGKIGEVRDVTSQRIVDILSEDSRNDFVTKIL